MKAAVKLGYYFRPAANIESIVSGFMLKLQNTAALRISENKADLFQMKARMFRTLLHHAARMGDVAFLETLLGVVDNPRPDINAVNLLHQTPLFVASREGHVEVVRKLLSAGASVTVPDSQGMLPTAAAAARGETRICKALLRAGSEPLSVDRNGLTPLHIATLMGQAATVTLFAKQLQLSSSTGKKRSAGQGPLPSAPAAAESGLRPVVARAFSTKHLFGATPPGGGGSPLLGTSPASVLVKGSSGRSPAIEHRALGFPATGAPQGADHAADSRVATRGPTTTGAPSRVPSSEKSSTAVTGRFPSSEKSISLADIPPGGVKVSVLEQRNVAQVDVVGGEAPVKPPAALPVAPKYYAGRFTLSQRDMDNHLGVLRLEAKQRALAAQSAAALSQRGKASATVSPAGSGDCLVETAFGCYSALALAVKRGRQDIARVLVRHGADPARPDLSGMSPYDRALRAHAAALAVGHELNMLADNVDHLAPAKIAESVAGKRRDWTPIVSVYTPAKMRTKIMRLAIATKFVAESGQTDVDVSQELVKLKTRIAVASRKHHSRTQQTLKMIDLLNESPFVLRKRRAFAFQAALLRMFAFIVLLCSLGAVSPFAPDFHGLEVFERGVGLLACCVRVAVGVYLIGECRVWEPPAPAVPVWVHKCVLGK